MNGINFEKVTKEAVMSEIDPVDSPQNPASLTTERRASVRYSTKLTTLCQKTAADTHDFWLLAKVQDLSASGVRLLVGSPFRAGALVDIEPIRPSSGFMRPLQARVVYSSQDANGGWAVGCEFPNPLSEEDLQTLL